MDKTFKFEATGEFPFKFFIEKALPRDENGKMVIEGVASTVNVDHDGERMAPEALISMASIINQKSVPLRIEHQKSENAIVGSVFEAKVDDRNQLWIKAQLDDNHPAASLLYDSLKRGTKLGLSVGGRIKSAVREFVESKGKMIKTFYDVMLEEVSVTNRPANFDAWLVAKSIPDSFAKSANVYKEFLFENPQLDYLQVFAKSIPDDAWREVESPSNVNKNNIMEKDKKEKSAETEVDTKEKSEKTETEKSAVSREEFAALGKMVNDGFRAIGDLMNKAMTKMTAGAEDQTQPKKEKEDPEVKAKAQGEDAMDAVSPDKKKDDPEVAAKAEDKKETTEKMEETDQTTKNIQSSIERLMNISKEMDSSETKTKAAEDETDTKEKSADETTEKSVKSYSQLDQFVAAVTMVVEKMSDKMKENGQSIPNFEKHMANTIKSDPDLQVILREMMSEPGTFKKSVVMGSPMMKLKDGRTFELLARESRTTIEKSAGKPKSFADVYKQDFSTANDAVSE